MKNRFVIGTAALLALGVMAATGARVPAAAQERGRPERRPLPTQGEPGVVAAADIAFARAAHDEGQWTAFRNFAASGAQMHLQSGLVDAAGWLAGRADPSAPVQWSPTAVWSSCDGSVAVSFGRFGQPDGLIGSYVTVWELQPDGAYKWVYDMGGLDDPQPPPPLPPVEESVDVIVVPGLDIIDGKVADCRVGAHTLRAAQLPDSISEGGQTARDGSLHWRWQHGANGTRRFVLYFLRDGEWQVPLDFTPGEPREAGA